MTATDSFAKCAVPSKSEMGSTNSKTRPRSNLHTSCGCSSPPLVQPYPQITNIPLIVLVNGEYLTLGGEVVSIRGGDYKHPRPVMGVSWITPKFPY